MTTPIRRPIYPRPRFTGAQGLAQAVKSATNRNGNKYTVYHPSKKLRLVVEPDGRDSYITGDRNDATGFATDADAREAGDRYGLAGGGWVVEGPKV